jgi:hypothetical protein
MLDFGDEGIDGLELRMGFPCRRLIRLVRRPQEPYEPIVAEDAVVDDEAAFGYVPAVCPDAFRRRYVAPSGLDGDPVPG